VNDFSPQSGGINSILLTGIRSTIDSAAQHLTPETRAVLLGPVLASFTTRGTGRTCFTLACFADGLRVVFDAILADGIISEEEIDESEDFLKEVAASFAKVRPEYARFASLRRDGILDFIDFYKQDSGSFGHKDESTKWSGITVCRNIADHTGSTESLDIFPSTLIDAAEMLLAADGISEEEILFLNDLKTEFGFPVAEVNEQAMSGTATNLHFPEEHWNRCCAFSPTASLLAIGGEGRIIVWDLTTLLPSQVIHGKREASVESLAFSDDGSKICAYFDDDYKVRVFDASTGARVGILDGEDDDMRIVGACAGNVLLTSNDTHVESWDLATSEKLSSFKVASGYFAKPTSIALDGDGKSITVAKEGDEDLRVYDWKETDRLGTCWGGHKEKVELVAPGNGTGSVFSVDEKGGLVAWQIPDGMVLRTKQLDLWAPTSLLTTNCGSKLIISGWSTIDGENAVILFVDTETFDVLHQIPMDDRAEITLSPDGKRLAIKSSEDGFLVSENVSEDLSFDEVTKVEAPADIENSEEWDEDQDPIAGEEKIEGTFDHDDWTLPLEGEIEWSDLMNESGVVREASLVSEEDWRLAQSENRVLTIEHSGDGMEYVGRVGLTRELNLCRVITSCSLPHDIRVVNIDVSDIDCNFFGAQEDNDQLSAELIEACGEGDHARAKQLITRGANANHHDWESELTPLRAAIRNGHREVIELLLKSGVETHSEHDAWTMAMVAGQIQVAEQLKESGFDAEPLQTLVQVCHRGVLSAARELIGMVESIDESADLYDYRSVRATPLTAACLAGNVEVAELLLDAGAEVTATDARGITPWVAAASGDHTGLCEQLERRGSKPDTQHAFVLAADRCRVDVLESLANATDINTSSTLDDTPMTAINAALIGRYACLDSGSEDSGEKDTNIGNTVNYLLDNGASADTKDINGEPLIHKAVNEGYQMVTRVLAEAGADLEAENSDGETAIVIAANNGNSDMVGRLLYRGANPNARNSEGAPASLLMFGEYMQCDSEMAKWFISYGVDLTATDNRQINMEQHCEQILESADDDEESDEYETDQARDTLAVLQDHQRLERLHGAFLHPPETTEQLDSLLQIAMEEYDSEASLLLSFVDSYVEKNLENSLPKIADLLKHDDWRFRYAAALNLDNDKLPRERMLPLIMAQLNDDDEDVRQAVFAAIVNRGDEGISAVIKALAQCPTECLQRLTYFLINMDSKWAQEIEQELLKTKPADPDQLTGSDRRHAGIVIGILGDFENQRENTELATELYNQSVRLNPNLQIGFWSELAETQSRTGVDSLQNALSMYNETYETEDSDEARSLLRKATTTAPSFPWALNNLAWDMATNSDETKRDGAKAVELATQLCKRDNWQYPGFLDTLAAAHAEAGNFEMAVKLTQTAIDLALPIEVEEYQQNLNRYSNGEAWPLSDDIDSDSDDDSNEWDQEYQNDVSSFGNAASIVAFLNAKTSHEKKPGWLRDPDGTVANSMGMKFVPIEAGEFYMGEPDCDEGENMGHSVQLTRPYLIGMFPVTQSEYFAVTGENPSYFAGKNRPVEQLSWSDAQQFCELLSDLPEEQAAGRRYRLPTEAEWEYACRAGTETDFNFGASSNPNQANFSDDGGQEEPQPTLPVGSFRPNAWGLYDTHGNVWEWCSDWFDEDYYEQSPPADPPGPASGGHHTLRGGAASNADYECVSYSRGEASTCDGPNREIPAYGRFEALGDFGIRLVCEIDA